MSNIQQPDRFGFLHIDLNSFFASVEQQLHPEYRGRPLAVVPTMADTTCCIAASYEAKDLGIKTGTQVGKAKEICPEIILIAGDHADYAKYSKAIAEAVELCCPVAHTPSIDEMVCQLMGREREPPVAYRQPTDCGSPNCYPSVPFVNTHQRGRQIVASHSSSMAGRKCFFSVSTRSGLQLKLVVHPASGNHVKIPAKAASRQLDKKRLVAGG